jgi:hypothetical protein
MQVATNASRAVRNRVIALAAGLAVLGVALIAAFALRRLERGRAVERAQAEAQAGGMRGLDALRALLSGFEVQVQNATQNPRLVAALDAGIDQETLRDLLLNEPWWEPFRMSVDGYGLVREGDAPEVATHLPDELDLGQLLGRVRPARRSASEIVAVAGQVFATVGAPIALPSRRSAPILVATKIVDVGTLASVAERAGGAVGISDGRHLLVGAAGAVPGATLDEVKAHVADAAPGVAAAGADGAAGAVAALPLGGGLRLLSYARLAGGGGGGGGISMWATLAIGLAGAVGVFTQLSRRRAMVPAAAALRPSTGRAPAAISSIGRYRVLERIGHGGMAEIYSAVTTGEAGFRRAVVIKRLRPQLTEDPGAVAQFCDEANLLAALHHPNIVAVQDFGRAGDQLFLAEEYVLGRNLGSVLKRGVEREQRALAPEAVAHVSHELLKALEYAHGMRNEQGKPLGIVHRDVSPENVMLSARGEVKLLDFGVVKSIEGRASKTDAGVVKGNIGFMSPEQARGKEIDARADLYAVGLVIYFCLTGKPLYDSDTSYGLLLKAGAGPGLEELAALSRLPKPFAALLRRAFAPNVENRFQSAREMAIQIESLVGDGGHQTSTMMMRLFGDELNAEARRLADVGGVHEPSEQMPS